MYIRIEVRDKAGDPITQIFEGSPDLGKRFLTSITIDPSSSDGPTDRVDEHGVAIEFAEGGDGWKPDGR